MKNAMLKSTKALITDKKRGYLLQLRDNNARCYYPDHWGLFGGHLNKNETFLKAIRREVKEETGLDIKVGRKIFEVKFKTIGLKKKRKLIYFECDVKNDLNVCLTEGQKYKFFYFKDLKKLKMIPLDFVAISAHHNNINNVSLSY